MKMTWATAEDHVGRLLPYLVPLMTSRPVPDALRESVERPYRVKRNKKQTHGRP
jgi:hypothetical protein